VPGLAEKQAIGAATRGVGRFVATHEHCGTGFEIIRDGNGKLHLRCSGCGAQTEYGSEDTEQVQIGGRARRFRPSQETMERWLPAPAALPWWVPNAYILAVILAGLGLIAFGVLRPGSEDRAILGSAGREDEGPPATVEIAPPRPEAVVAGAGAGPSPKPPPARHSPRAPDLDPVEVLGRFAIGIPPEWARGTWDGAVGLRSPDGEADLKVFLEPGSTKPGSLSDEASRYLADEHPGAGITRPKPIRIGRLRGVEVDATFDGGVERAVLLSANGYSYLVTTRVDDGASRDTRAASAAALRSFRPL
jgi:hypothetical protein